LRLLLDTHVLIWAAEAPEKLPAGARALLVDPANAPVFSVVSIWEVAIKRSLNRDDFNLEPAGLRHDLLEQGWEEIAVSGEHAVAVRDLPAVHRDPFDRLLVAQAAAEGLTLLTADRRLTAYPGSIRLI
jgi:PIN domain nuclease of toxin-antitoxin system